MAKDAIRIPVVISYNAKGTKEAVRGLGSIEKSFKKMGLARKLTLAAMTASIGAFAKQSVAAAMADEKAQKILSNTLKNLGLAYAALPLDAFIDNLQRASGVSEDLLRPAMQKLLLATGDVGKSQRLLNLALDLTAQTGKDVTVTAGALSKAYLGNTKSLFALGVGITKADLKTMSFEQQVAKLTNLVGGQAQVAVETYAGKMAVLQVSASEAKETIGYGLINALTMFGKDQSIEDAADAMETLAANTSFFVTGIADATAKFKSSALFKVLAGVVKIGTTPLVPGTKKGGALAGMADRGRGVVAAGITATNRQSPVEAERLAAQAAEKARLKAIKDEKALLLLKKQKAAVDKLKAMFDMDIIQLTAAKQRTLSAEDLARVNALIAIKTTTKKDDVTALEELEVLQKKNADAEIARANEILAVKKKNAAEILALEKDNAKAYATFVSTFTYSGGLFAGTNLAPQGNNAVSNPPAPMQTNVPNIPSSDLIDSMTSRSAGSSSNQAPNVTVNMQGGINFGTTMDFYESVWRAIENSNTYGNSLNRAGTG
jgi:hypothetical protein